MKRYDPEFKKQLVKEAKETGNTSMVARRHGVTVQTLSAWVRQSKQPSRDHASQEKVRKLETELEEQKLENEILKELLKKTNVAWLGGSKSRDDSSRGGAK